MEITIDTSKDLSEMDKQILKVLSAQTKEPDGKDFVEKIEKVFFPKIHGKTEETILQVLKYIHGGTVLEIKKYTDIPQGTLGGYLGKLVKKNLVETSTTKPKVYYPKGDNPDLDFALKNAKGKKFSNMR